ncbi:heme peroxidase [Gordonia sinesedis]
MRVGSLSERDRLEREEPIVSTDPGALARLTTACERDLGDPALWFRPDGYPNSLALCTIDSIYSTGSHYNSVVNVIKRYVTYRSDHGGNAYTDGLAELVATFEALDGASSWATKIGNQKKVSTRPGAVLKSTAVETAARSLLRLRVDTTDDLRMSAANEKPEPKQEWVKVPGQRSGVTWEYCQMLAGIPGVKADRMVVRYVARTLGVDTSDVSPHRAASLVSAVGAAKDWNVIHLDHAIWRFESGRPVNRDDD